MKKTSVCVEWLPAFKKWRVWNSSVESWYKNFNEFLQAVRDNHLEQRYYFYSYNKNTRKKLRKNGLTNE